jgi:hypothetical protein
MISFSDHSQPAPNSISVITLLIFAGFLAMPIFGTSVGAVSIYDGHTHSAPTTVQLRSTASGAPFIDIITHDINNYIVTLKNNGVIGPDVYNAGGLNAIEFMSFPRNTGRIYPTPHLWVGGVVGRDTLVSNAVEFWPATLESQISSNEGFSVRSILDTGTLGEGASSEQDISFVYYDTLTETFFTGVDDLDNRPHIPLNLRVKQTSYAWSFEFAEDFIIIDYVITNIGSRTISDAYIALEVRGGFDLDLIAGYKATAPAISLKPTTCQFEDSVALWWAADNDGNPTAGQTTFGVGDPTSVTAIKLLQIPSDTLTISYNWWDDSDRGPRDWGPRRLGTAERPFRNMAGIFGTPSGDKNRYYVMSSGEFDYDQIFSAVDHSADGWFPPSDNSLAIALGPGFGNHNHHYDLISFGPIELQPQSKTHFAIALVGGENFHVDPENAIDPFKPQEFMDNLNWDDLLTNVNWAKWIYDNPGVDTDNDGYRGEFRVCVNASGTIIDTTILIDTTVSPPDTTTVIDTFEGALSADTIFYTGDGVPDLRAASPPPAPDVRFEPSFGEIVIEWNGILSETTPDVFSGEMDFEGYRVYLGLDRSAAGLVMQSSYDFEDFTQFYFNRFLGVSGRWIIIHKPFSRIEVQDIYANGNRDYEPTDNGISNPLRVGDSAFYFIKQDFNQSDLTDPNGIQTIYPDEPYPHTLILDSAFTSDTLYTDPLTGETTFYRGGELTADGKRFKYFEYRFVARNLLPSQLYYASVTAFDFGSQGSNLPFLETNPVRTAIEMFALDRVPQQPAEELNVIVYPNPYRIDGNYRDDGFEGRGREDFEAERTRALNFINLPPECTIFIYSLDGDLLKQIEHNEPTDGSTAMHESWDLITRNLQIAVSGIYYFVIETPEGSTQLGKFVLIM